MLSLTAGKPVFEKSESEHRLQGLEQRLQLRPPLMANFFFVSPQNQNYIRQKKNRNKKEITWHKVDQGLVMCHFTNQTKPVKCTRNLPPPKKNESTPKYYQIMRAYTSKDTKSKHTNHLPERENGASFRILPQQDN